MTELREVMNSAPQRLQISNVIIFQLLVWSWLAGALLIFISLSVSQKVHIFVVFLILIAYPQTKIAKQKMTQQKF